MGMPGRVPVPPRLLVHDAAVPAEVAQDGRGGGELIQLPVGPLAEVPDGLVEHDDARAAALQLHGRALEHVDLAAEVAEDERGGEPAERAPDHRDPWPPAHGTSFGRPWPFPSRHPAWRR